MNKIIYIILCTVVFTGCSQRTHNMPSSSMEPTIPAGSKVTIDYAAYKTTPPARFDIVAFHPPTHTNSIFTLRIVALPGETIQITKKSILINGKKLVLPNGLRYAPATSKTNSIHLNSTQFFVLGDHTKNANDSRYFGPITRSNILGKVVKIRP